MNDTDVVASTQYQYILEASTIAGGTNSSTTSVVSPIVSPGIIYAPANVTVLNATSIFVVWGNMSTSLQVVDQYQVLLNVGTRHEIDSGSTSTFNYTFTSLLPYTMYSVRIRACLQGVPNGCGVGPSIVVQTFPASPDGQLPPRLIARGPQIVDIYWSPPVRPNGIMTQYKISRRLTTQSTDPIGLLVNVVAGTVLNYTNAAGDLNAFTSYDYRITAVSVLGETSSNWSTVVTLSSPPQVLNVPLISNISAFSFAVSWRSPLATNGPIIYYQLEYKTVLTVPGFVAQSSVIIVDSYILSTSISGLSPYSTYAVRVTAVNSAGNVSSTWTQPTTTGQAAPSGFGRFDVEKVTNGQSIILSWNAPINPNGQITSYLIYENGSTNAVYQGLNRQFEFLRLQPYTNYTVRLEACTAAGCARSLWQIITTAEIPPANQLSPTLVSVAANRVELGWGNLLNPNGRLFCYSVVRRMSVRIRPSNDLSTIFVTYNVSLDQYNYVDNSVIPYSSYDYLIRVNNSVGSTDSPWLTVATPQGAPQSVLPPGIFQVFAFNILLFIKVLDWNLN